MFLLRFRAAVSVDTLAVMFNVEPTTVRRLFLRWLVILRTFLDEAFPNPTQQSVRRTLPPRYRREKHGNKIRITIDTFPIYTQKPTAPGLNDVMYNHYYGMVFFSSQSTP